MDVLEREQSAPDRSRLLPEAQPVTAENPPGCTNIGDCPGTAKDSCCINDIQGPNPTDVVKS